jgi:hypothetical protein
MKLSECTTLLGDSGRYFSAVYEEFKFKDDDHLKDYLDFVLHEPVEWIKGFPLKLRTRLSFAKPKAAVIRLLKTPEILTELSAAYCSQAHDIVWDTFKKHGDEILEARLKKGLVGAGEQEGDEGPTLAIKPNTTSERAMDSTATEPPTRAAETNELFMEVTDISQEAESVKSVPEDKWERKYRIISAALRAVIEHPDGLNKALLILLDALEHS